MKENIDIFCQKPTCRRGARDLTGRKFGRLTALSPSGRRAADGCYYWLCRCDCGEMTEVSSNKLLQGRTTSCGCYKREKWQTGLTYVGGTCLEIVRSDKVPANNTSGVKGVSPDRGLWMVKLTFARHQFFLGRYSSFETAVAVRREAEHLRDEIIENIDQLQDQAVVLLSHRLEELRDRFAEERGDGLPVYHVSAGGTK